MKSMMLMFVMAILCFASCLKEEDVVYPGMPAGQVVANFKDYFYKDGMVKANKLDGFSAKEWAVATDNSARPCEVFRNITGVEASPAGTYEYSYSSQDGTCLIRIVGCEEPGEDAVYAILYVKLEGCPEVSKIYIGTREYFKDSNEAVAGVPVIL